MRSSTQNTKNTFANAAYRTYNDLRSQANFQQITPPITEQNIPNHPNATSKVQLVANKITQLIELCKNDSNQGNDNLTSIIQAQQGILNSLMNIQNQNQDPNKKSKVQFNQSDIQQIKTQTKLINPQTEANISSIQAQSRVIKGSRKKFITEEEAINMIQQIQGKAIREIQILKRYNNMIISQIDQLAADYQLQHHRRLWLQGQLQKLLDFLRRNSMIINFQFPEWYMQGFQGQQPQTIIQNLKLKTDTQIPAVKNVQTSQFEPVSTEVQNMKSNITSEQINRNLSNSQLLQSQEFTNFPNPKFQVQPPTPTAYQANTVSDSQHFNNQANTVLNIHQQQREFNLPTKQINYTLQTFNPVINLNNEASYNSQNIFNKQAKQQNNKFQRVSNQNNYIPHGTSEVKHYNNLKNTQTQRQYSKYGPLSPTKQAQQLYQKNHYFSNQPSNNRHQVQSRINDMNRVNNYINHNIQSNNIEELQKILEITENKANAYKAQMQALQGKNYQSNRFPGILQLLQQEDRLRKQTITMLRIKEQHQGRGQTFGIPSKKKTQYGYGSQQHHYY